MYVRKVIINVKINACTNFARKITGIFTKQRDKLFFRTCHYQKRRLVSGAIKKFSRMRGTIWQWNSHVYYQINC